MEDLSLLGYTLFYPPSWTLEEEIIQAIRTQTWGPAKRRRLDCRMNFEYGQKWNGKIYATKQVARLHVLFEDSDLGILFRA